MSQLPCSIFTICCECLRSPARFDDLHWMSELPCSLFTIRFECLSSRARFPQFALKVLAPISSFMLHCFFICLAGQQPPLQPTHHREIHPGKNKNNGNVSFAPGARAGQHTPPTCLSSTGPSPTHPQDIRFGNHRNHHGGPEAAAAAAIAPQGEVSTKYT